MNQSQRKYFMAQSMIDSCYFFLSMLQQEIQKRDKKRSGIDRAIDEATGYGHFIYMQDVRKTWLIIHRLNRNLKAQGKLSTEQEEAFARLTQLAFTPLKLK